tara:strand:+ start:221 stop:3202 length:2982 start_codon:yes stop_codon:yes gene_type:complete
MKKLIVFTFLCSILFPRELVLNKAEALSVKSTQKPLNIIDNENNLVERTTREDIVLFHWDFEVTDSLWIEDAGWSLTTDNFNSETHSYNSPNTPETYNAVWNLVSPTVTMPELGDGEIMRFKFALTGEMPDTDGDGDGYLEDYYQLAIMDLEALAWHPSTEAPETNGTSYWCADETIGSSGGYLDEWMQYLDTPSITIGDDATLSAKLRWRLEDPAGAVVAGSCTDGWDAANVRISTDGGNTWDLLEDNSAACSDESLTNEDDCLADNNRWNEDTQTCSDATLTTEEECLADNNSWIPGVPYDFDCGYGWIYNDAEYDTGGSLNQVAPGWGGNSFGDDFVDFSADLSTYAGEDVIVRFAFGSDPAYNTNDQDDMTGFQVDNIVIEDSSGALYSDDADSSVDNNTMTPSGEVWEAQFYDYLACEDERPGACGAWEWYEPGFAFNGNVLHDISHLAGKDVIVKFSTRYDADDDGGVGTGFFMDDFIIYKESSGNTPPPSDLTAEAGDTAAMLTWQDMNLSGTFDYDFTNSPPQGGITMNGESTSYAGERYYIAGASTVESIDIYNINAAGASVTIAGFGTQGALFNTEPSYTMEVDLPLANDWNTIDLSGMGWTFDNGFILAHSFDNVISAALDETAFPSTNSMILFQGGSWDTWANSSAGSDGAVNDGEWGIKSTITQVGAGVTYNVQRDGLQVASGIETNMYTDTGLTNNLLYNYTVSATYPDGTESDPSNSVEVTPQANTVHLELWDDGTAEAYWEPEGTGQLAAVKFSGHNNGEQLIRFHWFQVDAGGAFYITIWEDDNGMPGTEIAEFIQVAGNADGWNARDLVSENIDLSCDFWIGMRRFSSSMPIGIDLSSNAGNSMNSDGGDNPTWNTVEGNVMFRVDLDAGEQGGIDCNLLNNEDDMMPTIFEVSNAYPNPFNPSTTIDVSIPEAGLLNVGVYNLKGQLMSTLVNKNVYPGSYSLSWDASNLTSGLYIFSVSYGDKTYNQKVTLVK